MEDIYTEVSPEERINVPIKDFLFIMDPEERQPLITPPVMASFRYQRIGERESRLVRFKRFLDKCFPGDLLAVLLYIPM